MAYDITNPDKILFANYINSRDFSKDIAGDVSPEGLCMISASEAQTEMLICLHPAKCQEQLLLTN